MFYTVYSIRIICLLVNVIYCIYENLFEYIRFLFISVGFCLCAILVRRSVLDCNQFLCVMKNVY